MDDTRKLIRKDDAFVINLDVHFHYPALRH